MRVSQRLGVLFGCLLFWSAGVLALGPAWSCGTTSDPGRPDSKAAYASLAAGFDDDDLDTMPLAAPAAPADGRIALLRPAFSQDWRVVCAPRLADRRAATLVGVVVLLV